MFRLTLNTVLINDWLAVLLVPMLLFYNQTPTYGQCTSPTTENSSICGTGSASLTASGGSKPLYYWYNESMGGNVIGSGSLFNTPSINATDTFYVSQYDTQSTNDAIIFDGTNDYIAIEDFNYSEGGQTGLTVECWIKTNDGTDQVIASFDRNRYWRLEINGSGAGPGQIGFDLMTDDGQLDFGSISTVNDGSWHHIAAVFDNGTVSIYIDGVLDNSTSKGTSFGNASTAFGFVGTGSEASVFDGNRGPNSYFNGEMDEFRIWNRARTADEITNNKDKCLIGLESDLAVYYRMDETGSVDSVIDYSPNDNHGKLRNFFSPGGSWSSGGTTITDCPFCESARDTSIVTVNALPSPNLGLDTCITTSFTLDAGPNYSSYLWNTGAITRTITADTSQFYFVTVDSAGTPCQGTNGLSVSLLTQPEGTDTSRCGPGNVTLTASGGSGKYYWYSVPNGGTPAGEGTPWTSTTINNTDTFYLASIENDTTRQGLTFDGVNDYVSLNMSFSTSGELPAMTVEAWVKTSVSGLGYSANWSMLDFDRSEYFAFFVHGGDGTVGFSTADTNGVIDDFYGPTSHAVNDGNWHHVAAVYDGTDKKIYVDGTLVATKANAHGGLPIGSGNARYGFIGDGSEAGSANGPRNNLFFQGELDEIRLWSDERNLLEIQNNKDRCILGVESDLLTYYKMENGSGSNTLTDHSNQGNTGTLRNMNLTNSWINTGPYVTCSCGSGPRDTVIVTIEPVPQVSLGNDTCVPTPLLLDAGPGMSVYLWQDVSSGSTLLASNSQAYHVTVDSIGTTCQGKDTIIVNVGKATNPTATDSSRCGSGMITLKGNGQGTLRWYDQATGGSLLGSGDSINVGPLSGDSTFYFSSTFVDYNTLSFDGIGDVVAISNYSYYGAGKTAMTVEAWIKTASSGNQIVASFDRSEFWRLEINGDAAGAGQVGFGINTNNGIIDLGSNARVDDNTWHHIAAVFNAGTATIYIDGVADNSTTLGSTWGKTVTRFGFLGVGSEANAFDGTQGPFNYFNGSLDEVRIWSDARTPTEINTFKDQCLAGNEANLEVYYRISEGNGSTIKDFKGNAEGILKNTTWSNDGLGFTCSACSESDRISIQAKVYPSIDNSDFVSSCPAASGAVFGFKGYGGSGRFDYKETSGVFDYSGSFDADTVLRQIPNGGSYTVVVKDENNCTDTLTGVTTTPAPNLGSIAVGSSAQTCRIPPFNDWFYLVNSSNDVLLAIHPNSNNLGQVNATAYLESNAALFDGNAYMKRHFLISPERQPSSSVGVRLYFTDAEYNNLADSANNNVSTDDDINSIADLGITKYSGPTEDGVLDTDDASSLIFISQENNGASFGGKYIQFSTPGFSEMWMHASASASPLPVELLDFSVEQTGNSVSIKWSTGSEINNAYFDLEKSKDAVNFQTIHQVSGQGNSNGVNDYNFVDTAPNDGYNYYRIKQVDFDGRYSYSDLLWVFFTSNSTDQQLVIAPSPTASFFKIIGLKNSPKNRIRIFDSNGKLVLQNKAYSDIMQVSHLPKGLYIVEVTTNEKNIFLKMSKQ